MLDGKIGQLSTKLLQIVSVDHPPIFMTGLIKQNAGLWEPGTILTRTGGLLAPWDGTAGEPVGVLTDHCDSTGQASAHYLVHGGAVIENLKLAGGGAPSETQLFSLAKAGIYGA